MTEGTTPESHATSAQIHPLLRQRMLNRAATFAEGAHPISPSPGRRSSNLSEYSDTRHSFRSSTDSLFPQTHKKNMDTLATSNEPTVWHSAPLAFAILPAAAGVFFQDGSAVVTDILLLGLCSLFLNFCVRAPWDWYHAARQVRYVEVDEEPLGDTIFEEHEGSEDPREDEHNSEAPVIKSHTRSRLRTRAQESAERKLAREEVMALIACFIGPLLGTFILHAIRSQLTRSAEGLVSNYNLTVFTMAAEIRPVSHIIKMKQSQTVHLQRVVRGENQSQLAKAETETIMRRLAEVEARIAEPTVNSDVETVKIGATVRQSLQPQLDALNRAVRRYEKRQAAQSMQLEARFGELEMQLRDALSLAAAAARSGQRPGAVSMAFTWIVDIFTYILQTSWAAATYPLRLTTALGAEIKSWFVRAEHQPRKRLKGQSTGHASNPAPRMQSRTGR